MPMMGLPPRGERACVLAGLGALLSVALLSAVSVSRERPQYTFVPLALGTVPRFGAPQALPEPSALSTPSSSLGSTALPQVLLSGLGCVLAVAVVSAASRRRSRGADTKIIRHAGNSKTGQHSRGDMGSMGQRFFTQNKQMMLEEDREPTEIPLWQRDFSYAMLLQQREMMQGVKRGQKMFWQVLCVGECYYMNKDQKTVKGYAVEVMASGLEARIPLAMAGDTPLETGKVYWTECIRIPWRLAQPRRWHNNTVWPKPMRTERAWPEFSVRHYEEHMKNMALARLHTKGEMVEGTIRKKVIRGFIVELDSGLFCKWRTEDISRRPSPGRKLTRMFAIGTRIKAIVLHADHDSGRVHISTKEFEDDEHIGWMMQFPERCFANAEKTMEEYFRKKERWVEWLQETDQGWMVQPGRSLFRSATNTNRLGVPMGVARNEGVQGVGS